MDQKKTASLLLRLDVEDFLFREALLLDQWRLDDWLSLFATPCAYEVTPTGEDDLENLSPDRTLFLLNDDRFRLEQRIHRLKQNSAHSERPRSRLQHAYANVRIEQSGIDMLSAWTNMTLDRSRNGFVTHYFGVVRFDLTRTGDSFRIDRKRVMLGLEALVPQGALSFVI